MKMQKHADDVNGEWVVIFNAGDKSDQELKQFAADERLEAADFTGIGAFDSVTGAWFDVE